MNLVQIQNRLRDVPLQALMAYANGVNPEVPPYLALSEMDRRKRVEKSAQTPESPQGTVKEQLEQQAGLMALMKARQAQAAQQSAQAPAQRPFVPAQGVPQPADQPEMEETEMLMAAGGVTALPVRDEDFEYGGGGIVAFADGSDKKGVKEKDEDKKETYETPYDRMNRQNRQREAAEEAFAKTPEGRAAQIRADRASMMAPFASAADIVVGGPANAINAGLEALANKINFARMGRAVGLYDPDVTSVSMPRVGSGTATPFFDMLRQYAQGPSGAPVATATNQATATPAPAPAPSAAPAPAPATGPSVARPAPTPGPTAARPTAPAPSQTVPDDQFMKFLQTQMNAGMTPPKSAQQRIAEEIQKNPNSPLALDPFKYDQESIANLERRRQTERQRFENMEQERAKRDFFRSLIAGGEATRGQKGIGALLGGYGRYSMGAQDLADERRNAFENLDIQREENAIKMRSEIQKAKIAREEGRFKDAANHDMEVEKLRQKDTELKVLVARTGAEILSKEREGAANRLTEIQKAGIMASVAAERAGAKGQLTYDQAADNVDKRIEKGGFTFFNQYKKADKEAGRAPRTNDQIRRDLIDEELSRSGTTLPGAPGTVKNLEPPPHIKAIMDKFK